MALLESAYTTLKKRIESNEWKSGDRLPSLLELASLCGVSRSTLSRVLARLKQEGLLHTTTRLIVAGPAGAPGSSKPVQPLAWKRLANRIGTEILHNSVTSPLPPVSKLAIHYACSRPTIKKSLDYLVREKVLGASGKRYTFAAASGRLRATITLIAAGSEPKGIVLQDERTTSLVAGFEQECIKGRYRYQLVPFNDQEPFNARHMAALLPPRNTEGGIIVSLWDPWNPTLRDRWMSLLALLATMRRPVVVIDQSGSLRLPDTITRTGMIRVLSIAGTRAGEMVADFLIQNNHRTIAFITPDNFDWAENRFKGLQRRLQSFGGLNPVLDFHVPAHNSPDVLQLVLELTRLSWPKVAALWGKRIQRDEMEGLRKQWEASRRGAMLHVQKNDAKAQTIRAEADHLSNLARREHDPSTFDALFDAMGDRASSYAFETYLTPLFRHILKSSRATIWACSDAKTGIAACEFLAKQGIPVPARLQVLAFDNWRLCAPAGLTSYDLNMQGMVIESLALIRDERRFKAQPLCVQQDGYIVERRTTKSGSG